MAPEVPCEERLGSWSFLAWFVPCRPGLQSCMLLGADEWSISSCRDRESIHVADDLRQEQGHTGGVELNGRCEKDVARDLESEGDE